MKKFLIVILLLFIVFQGYSQSIKFGFQTGRSRYHMEELIHFNENIQETFPFETRQVSAYPPFWYYQPMFLIEIHAIDVGFYYNFQSTGARVSAKDYSGEYRFDSYLKSNALGLYFNVSLGKIDHFEFTMYAEAGGIKSNLKMTDYMNVMDSTFVDETYHFYSKNMMFEPGLGFSYYPFKFIGIEFNVGYSFVLGKKMYYSDKLNTDLYYTDDHDRHKIKPEWNGLRYGVGVFFRL